jgi:hypothetical protein
MLQIGSRSYQLVRAHSGFGVVVDDADLGFPGKQAWRFEAHYVPGDEDPGPPLEAPWEYWRLMINPMNFVLSDWRELADPALWDWEKDAEPFYPMCVTIENLLPDGMRGAAERTVRPGHFRVIRREGFLFTCEFDGEIVAKEGEEVAGEFRLLDEFPFFEAAVHVPINAADPIVAARAMAAREIALTESARTFLKRFDPERGRLPRILGPGRHSVTIETAWRAR